MEDYLSGRGESLVAEFVEVETGNRQDKPKLDESPAHWSGLCGNNVTRRRGESD